MSAFSTSSTKETKMRRLWILIVIMVSLLPHLKAQDTLQVAPREDTLILKQDFPEPVYIEQNSQVVVKQRKHSPKTATWLALIPGAGQAYNRKYWKMPIVYAGFGATIYFAVTNKDEYHLYRDAYDYKMGTKTDVSQHAIEESEKYTPDNLITLRDYYRRNMELSWIITAAWYVLQIIDANVDAHFFYYEISDDLTLHVEPQCVISNDLTYSNNIGVKLQLNF